MKRFEVVVSGVVYRVCDTREEAEEILAFVRNSFLGKMHPYDCIKIREK